MGLQTPFTLHFEARGTFSHIETQTVTAHILKHIKGSQACDCSSCQASDVSSAHVKHLMTWTWLHMITTHAGRGCAVGWTGGRGLSCWSHDETAPS